MSRWRRQLNRRHRSGRERDPILVSLDRETDGRWLAEVAAVSGAIAYGATPSEAARNALGVAELANDHRPVQLEGAGLRVTIPGRWMRAK